jgi:hypothetical protein
MARPIGATPVLSGEEAVHFLTMLHEDSKKPVGLTPTPKLNKAHELVKKYGENRQKHLR